MSWRTQKNVECFSKNKKRHFSFAVYNLIYVMNSNAITNFINNY